MSDMLTLSECALATGISARVWRAMARAGQVAHERAKPLDQILIPIEEVAYVVVSGYKPARGKPRTFLLPTSDRPVTAAAFARESERRKAMAEWLAALPADRSLWTATELFERYRVNRDPETMLTFRQFTEVIRDRRLNLGQQITTPNGPQLLFATGPNVAKLKTYNPRKLAEIYNRERSLETWKHLCDPEVTA
jgi:hypothetical protein